MLNYMAKGNKGTLKVKFSSADFTIGRLSRIIQGAGYNDKGP